MPSRPYLLVLGCIAVLGTAAPGCGAARPPTLDPTYGMPLPRAARAAPRSPVVRASWIWAAATRNGQTVGVRRRFTLPAAPTHAEILATADDHFVLYVNGEKLFDNLAEAGEAWRTAHRIDLTRHLGGGPNVLAIEGRNDGSEAGITAALRVTGGGHPRGVSTDASWKAHDGPLPSGWERTDFDDSGWPAATVKAPVGEGVWGAGIAGWPGLSAPSPYLHTVPVPPTAMLHARNLSFTLGPSGASIDLARMPTAGARDTPTMMVDFGREITGRVEIRNDSAGPVHIAMRYGESEDEAINGPYTGVQNLDLPPRATTQGLNSAYRYARIDVLSGPRTVRLSGIRCLHLYYPVEYRGSFASSDPLLDKIWYTGAYTSHLCMQDDIWDAPKRDRARWMGDLQVSGEVINDVFLDRFLMEQTMDRLRADAGQPPHSHVNGIPGYSCAWVVGMADFYRHTGDLAYLKKHHADLISIMDFFRGELDDRGLFANRRGEWPYVDWSPNFNGADPHALKSTHFFMVRMLKDGAWLLREMGDASSAARFSAWARDAVAAAQRYLAEDDGTFGDRWQENAMAVYSGVATAGQKRAIWDKVLGRMYPEKLMITPYNHNYTINAMSMIGHTGDALAFIRDYWGGMIREGATSFWEGYDTRWPKKPFHRYLQADNGMGYFVSLSHGWSSGATSWLTEQVLGIRPTGAGFRTVEIVPDLAGLAWARGTVPTPRGSISASYRAHAGVLIADLAIPPGTEATVRLPDGIARRIGPGHHLLRASRSSPRSVAER